MRREKTLELLGHARDGTKYPKTLTDMIKSTKNQCVDICNDLIALGFRDLRCRE